MIPNVGNRGTSFKGAGLYFLNDKKLEGEKSRSTSDRVAWTATRNTMTDDPDFAFRIMASTAMQKDQLKEAAGIGKGGRKSKGDVYAYSLAWHPEETDKIDRAEMMKAADQSIKALGAEDRQAVIICHRDEPHPHVHVVINLVSPTDGKNLPLSNDFKKLEKWAHEYRKGRGEEEKYCQDRTKKFEVIEAKKRGEDVPFSRGKKSVPRGIHSDFDQAKTAVNQNEAEAIRAREGSFDSKLVKDGERQASKHGHQWDALSDNYKLRKKSVWDRYKKEKIEAKEETQKQFDPAYLALRQKQSLERQAFKNREKRLTGKLINMRDTARYIAEVRGEKDSNIIGMAFNFLSSKGNRQAWFKKYQRAEMFQLARQERSAIKEAENDCASLRKNRLKSVLQDFKLERGALIGKQQSERQDLKHRWKIRSERKKKAFAALATKGKVAEKDRDILSDLDKSKAKRSFKARTDDTRAERQSRGRTRSRKRTRDDD